MFHRLLGGDTYSEIPIQENIQKCLSEADVWFKDNRLVVNASKSSTMVITTPNTLKNMVSPPTVTINGVTLPNCSSSKLLGLVIDNTLKWDKHIEYVCK